MVFRLAVAQARGCADPSAHEIHRNGAHIRRLMRDADAARARLVQFHEGALSGYPAKTLMSGPNSDGEADWSTVAWDVLRNELVLVAALARELELWVVVGSVHPLTTPSRPHNSLYVISADGELVTRYDKRLLSHTEISFLYAPGRQPVTFEVDGIRFGCVICVEGNFPELFMEYERLGVDCVLFPSYSDDPMFGILAQGHAAGNSYWVAFSPPAHGSRAVPAGVAAPDGTWMGRGPTDGTPAVVVVDLDAATASAKEATRYRRPWRRVARDDGVYEKHFVTDPRSTNRTTF